MNKLKMFSGSPQDVEKSYNEWIGAMHNSGKRLNILHYLQSESHKAPKPNVVPTSSVTQSVTLSVIYQD